ncbi:heme oxygenase [Cytobacillus sp. FSL M8-0252]|uniref:heme oxygenase n=1 Tax=Cytobacillus sp. FSL M8-0252 TaxID=2921621 RepID=UPI0030F8F361
MYIVTNTVHLQPGNADMFVERFNREGKVETMPGFVGLEVMLTENTKDYEEITIVTRWEDPTGFKGWMKSREFKDAHVHRGGIPEFIIKNKTTYYQVKLRRKPRIETESSVG